MNMIWTALKILPILKSLKNLATLCINCIITSKNYFEVVLTGLESISENLINKR
jgi:hypothetical protein